MGYYIETGRQVGKARDIMEAYGGRVVDYNTALNTFSDTPREHAVIVVVSNGAFEAAGFAYNEREFHYTTRPNDDRPKCLLTIPWATAVKLTGFKETLC